MQPFAWAIIYGGKNIENRTLRSRYRGPLAIHAGLGWVPREERPSTGDLIDPLLAAEVEHLEKAGAGPSWTAWEARGAVLGTVDLIDMHDGIRGCCGPWGERGIAASGDAITHLVLANPRPINPRPWTGAQGLWELPDFVIGERGPA